MSSRQVASTALLVAVLLAYPFVDHALQAQTVYAVTDGMITLRQSALKKVLSGETTLREINRVTFSEER